MQNPTNMAAFFPSTNQPSHRHSAWGLGAPVASPCVLAVVPAQTCLRGDTLCAIWLIWARYLIQLKHQRYQNFQLPGLSILGTAKSPFWNWDTSSEVKKASNHSWCPASPKLGEYTIGVLRPFSTSMKPWKKLPTCGVRSTTQIPVWEPKSIPSLEEWLRFSKTSKPKPKTYKTKRIE